MPIRLRFFTDATSTSLSELSMVDSEAMASELVCLLASSFALSLGLDFAFDAAVAGARFVLVRTEVSALLSLDMALALIGEPNVVLLSFTAKADRGLFTPLEEEVSETRSLSPPVLAFEPIEGAFDMLDGSRDTVRRDGFAEVVRLMEVNDASVCEPADLKEDSVLFEFVLVAVDGTVSVLRDDTEVPFRGDFVRLLLGVMSSSSSSLLSSATSSSDLDLFNPRFIARTLSRPAGVRKVRSASSTSSPLSFRPSSSDVPSLSTRRLPSPSLSSSPEPLREMEPSLRFALTRPLGRLAENPGRDRHCEDEEAVQAEACGDGVSKDRVGLLYSGAQF